MDWWSKIKQLFKEGEQSSAAQPAEHRVLKRDFAYELNYQDWQRSIRKRRFLDWLIQQYVVFQTEPSKLDRTLDFLDTPSSKGFVVHLHQTSYLKEESQFILDHLKERVRESGYMMQLSDWRIYNRPKWVESVERYYLKPRPNFIEDEPINQHYGNIRIELVFRDEQVYHLKFSATGYHDRLYKEAASFKDLLQHLCL